jgi:hypothetical protein
VAKRSGDRPLPEVTDFFLYKAFKFAKTPRHLRQGVSTQASDSFEFLADAESFWELHSAISGGQVNNGQEENCSFFENFPSQFSEKMFKRGIFNKRGIIKLPRIKSFAFATRFPVGKWPSVRFAIQLTNRTS